MISSEDPEVEVDNVFGRHVYIFRTIFAMTMTVSKKIYDGESEKSFQILITGVFRMLTIEQSSVTTWPALNT